MNKYILYVKNDCSFCHSAVDLLEEKKLDYDLISIGNYPDDLFDSLKEAYSYYTAPMIFERVGDTSYELIGGFLELERTICKKDDNNVG